MDSPTLSSALFDILNGRLLDTEWNELAYILAPGPEHQYLSGDIRISLLDFVRSRGLETAFVQLLLKRRQDLKDLILKDSALSPIATEILNEKGTYVNFVNREAELNSVLYPNAPAYSMIIAPAGYGKSEFLRELQKRFEHDEWLSSYVNAETLPSTEMIVKDLLEKFKIPHSINWGQDARGLGISLAAAVAETMREKPKRISLLFDFDKTTNDRLLKELVEGFIPGMQEELYSDLGYFQTCHNPFRVLIACRYFPSISQWSSDRKFRPLPLGPFSFNVVEMTVSSFLGSIHYPAGYLSKFSSHLLYLTGGHPGCMAQILDLHSKQGRPNPESFFFQNEQTVQLVNSIISTTIVGIIDEIDPEIRKTLAELSVFRKTDNAILKSLLSRGILDHPAGVYDLEDKLTSSHIVTRNGYWLEDGITRRLLNIYSRRLLSSKDYTQSCELAKSVYEERLLDKNERSPYIWAIEYLFECVQMLASDPRHQTLPITKGKEFFDIEVPKVLKLLKKGRNWKVERNPLEEEMRKDWELAFMINYALGDKSQGILPFERLIQAINLA